MNGSSSTRATVDEPHFSKADSAILRVSPIETSHETVFARSWLRLRKSMVFCKAASFSGVRPRMSSAREMPRHDSPRSAQMRSSIAGPKPGVISQA